MARLPIPGSDDGRWGEVLNDFLDVAHINNPNDPNNGALKPLTPDKLVPGSNGQVVATVSGAPAWTTFSNLGVSLDDINDVTLNAPGQGQVLKFDGTKWTNQPDAIATAGSGANLSATRDAASVTVHSDTGTSAVIAAADTTNAGTMTASDKTKLDGVAAGAQVNTVASVAGRTGAVTLAKTDVGLGSVDNTSDVNKPVSTATQTALNLKADNSAAVHLTGNETVAGVKTFSSSPAVPTPSVGTDAANKSYVDSIAASGIAPDATTSSKGIVQLAGDLGGTAATPTVATGAITGTKIAGGTITDTNISASAAIAKSKLAALNIGSSDIVSGGLPASSIANTAETVNNKGTANGYAPLGSNSKVPSTNLPVVYDRALIVKGNASVGTNVLPPGIMYIVATSLVRVDMHVSTAPAGSALTVQLRQTGGVIATVSIAAGSTKGTVSPSGVTITALDPVLFDITTVGSATPGADVMLTISTAAV